MNHERTVRAVAFTAVGYVLVLVIWASWLRPNSPPGTLPYQLIALVAGFGSALGLGMLVANRRTAVQRHLKAKGVEGWARIEFARRIDATSTELHLQFTIPGSESFAGRIVYSIPPSEKDRFEAGRTVPIIVDPSDHRQVLLLPGETFNQK